MPRYIAQSWNGYQIEVLPTDRIRRFIHFSRAKFIPSYFMGNILLFDVLVFPPKKTESKPLTCEWLLFDSKGDPVSNTNEMMSSGSFTMVFPKKNPLFPLNPISINGAVYRHLGNKWRLIHGVNLGLIAKKDDYTLKLRFSNGSGKSPYLTTVIFDLASWDEFTRSTGSAILAGVLGGVLVSVIWQVISHNMGG
jgi:hypothetical protein